MNLWLGTAASYCESLTGSQAIKRYGSSGDRKKPSSSAHPACSRQPLALSLESKSRRARPKTPRISAPVSLNSAIARNTNLGSFRARSKPSSRVWP